jgi:hypothetical protein
MNNKSKVLAFARINESRKKTQLENTLEFFHRLAESKS